MILESVLFIASTTFLLAAFGTRVRYHGQYATRLSFALAALAFVGSLAGVIL